MDLRTFKKISLLGILWKSSIETDFTESHALVR